MPELILSARQLQKNFRLGKRTVKAVQAVDLDIRRGECFGLVGESGCGKSTLGKSLLRLIEPTAGTINFDGVELTRLSARGLKQMRRHMQLIFQDPYASLNPRMTIMDIIGEGLDIHRLSIRGQRRNQIVALLEMVGLGSDALYRYPHEFSGGQRQRIGIARALAPQPNFIICDEPISALDLSIQAQVVNLLKDLQKQMGLTYLFIAHDLEMVRHVSDRVGVMYLGHFMEIAPADALYAEPLHPYTLALFSAVPLPDPRTERRRSRIVLPGDVPSPLNPPSGCLFHTRCPLAWDRCRREIPKLQEADPGCWVACHLYDQGKPTAQQTLRDRFKLL